MTKQECTNQSIGVKLHAFELGLLDQQDRRQVEQHLLECDYCFSLAQKHADHMKVLSSSSKVHEELISGVAEEESVSDSELNGAYGGNKYFRLAWAAAAVLVTALAATYLFGPSGDNKQTSVQTIQFSALRSAQNTEILLSEAGKAVLEFPLESISEEQIITVSIRPVFENGTHKQDVPWTELNSFGAVELDIAEFEPGLYNFVVKHTIGDSIVQSETFTFSVRKP